MIISYFFKKKYIFIWFIRLFRFIIEICGADNWSPPSHIKKADYKRAWDTSNEKKPRTNKQANTHLIRKKRSEDDTVICIIRPAFDNFLLPPRI